ncbi:exonuclease domain-containing protein [Demequina capsici]|uniref:Exonuclease domain-containing protein n=1 Tax=Demequina capsici TaxID=3075620 RepID=A0AA96FA68_9MICO|nr:exonuclease domain-containing protein [Demequina sp. PMTSA13]WNM26394.1 exonuclease domain-containing protein [Demequina sp. PMTSA13]
MSGFAVVDLETTGFAYNSRDRICEVAVVLVDRDGRQEGTYSTLVNPQRDLGAQHVHGISARDARLAPTFDLIAGDLASLLAGRVFVAHNSTFDASFLIAEFARAGWPLSLTREETLCTMRLAAQYGAPAKLGDCCRHFGIPLDDAHEALADAVATAGLLARYIEESPRRDEWDQWLEFGESLRWPSPPRLATPPFARGSASAGGDLLAGVSSSLSSAASGAADVVGAEDYLDLLDRVLLDRRISAAERAALSSLAGALGLGAGDVARLNRRYMLGVVEAVCADDVLTANDNAAIIQLAGLLDLEALEVEALLASAESRVSSVAAEVELRPGDRIVFTGMSMDRKRELTALAEARGLVVWLNVTKRVRAVVAQDPASQSGKARKAREYGIPVLGQTTI